MRAALLTLAALAALAVIGSQPAFSGEVSVHGFGSFSVPVTSMREAKFASVYEQQYDFSCGSAAVASLLTYHYDRPTTELEVFEAMYAAGDQERIERVGFSMLDMKTYLANRGLPSDGYRVNLDRLTQARLPAIVLIDVDGYRHFVIVKGITRAGVLLGDPARGTRIVTQERFTEIWNGIAFVLKAFVEAGRETFNRSSEWAVVPPAPYGRALNRTSLATVTGTTFRAGQLYGFGR